VPDEIVTLKVNGKAFSSWESLTLTENLDEVADAFSFSSGFNPNRSDLVESFRPMGYQPCTVEIDGELMLTGTLEFPQTSTSADSRDLNAQGRSLPGVLVDCPIDIVNGPRDLQWRDVKLGRLATIVATPYGIKVVTPQGDSGTIKIANSFGADTATVANEPATGLIKASPGDTVAAFLVGIAKPMGWLLNSSPKGELQLVRSETNLTPVAKIEEGKGSFLGARSGVDGTKLFQKTRVIQQMGGWPDIKSDATNPAVKLYRLKMTAGSSGNPSQLATYAQWDQATALAEAFSLEVDVTGWKTDAGVLWRKGQAVSVLAPGAFILRETDFVIAGVTRTLSTEGRTTTLRLVFPGAYAGTLPSLYPWSEVIPARKALRGA
jgi:prophage tail gpP-like protein